MEEFNRERLVKDLQKYLDIASELQTFCIGRGISPKDFNIAIGIAFCVQSLYSASQNKEEPEVFLMKNIAMAKDLSLALFEQIKIKERQL